MNVRLIPVLFLLVPTVIMLYMTAEVYFRKPKSGMNRLVALHLLIYVAILSADYLVQVLPEKDAVFAYQYIELFSVVLSATVGLYFMARFARPPIRPLFIHLISLMPMAGIPWMLNHPPWFKAVLHTGPIWRWTESTDGLLLLIVCIYLYFAMWNALYLVSAYRRLRGKPGLEQYRKQLKSFVWTLAIGAAWSLSIQTIFKPLMNSSPYLPDDVTLAEYSIFLFAYSVRYAMFNYGFLSTAESRFGNLFQRSPLAMAIYDEQFHLVEANPTYLRLFGFTDPADRSWQHASLSDLVSFEADEWSYRQTVQSYRDKKPLQFEFAFTNRLKESYALETNLSFFESEGQIYSLATVKDTSEMKKRIEAEEARRAKGELLARMSHEIRTPLNGIIGLTLLMQKTELSGIQQDYVGKLDSSSQWLLGLINDILDFSKIDAGKLMLEKASFRPRELLKRLSDEVSASIGKKPVEYILDCTSELPDALVGDPLRLEQVLMHLCGNAVRYTERGFVLLQIRLHDGAGEDQGAILSFTVADTGIGMTEEQQRNLFSPFSQAELSPSSRQDGAGLGLVICKQLVDLMGGQLEADSHPGRGSRFRFAIPLQLPSGTELPAMDGVEAVR